MVITLLLYAILASYARIIIKKYPSKLERMPYVSDGNKRLAGSWYFDMLRYPARTSFRASPNGLFAKNGLTAIRFRLYEEWKIETERKSSFVYPGALLMGWPIYPLRFVVWERKRLFAASGTWLRINIRKKADAFAVPEKRNVELDFMVISAGSDTRSNARTTYKICAALPAGFADGPRSVSEWPGRTPRLLRMHSHLHCRISFAHFPVEKLDFSCKLKYTFIK